MNVATAAVGCANALWREGGSIPIVADFQSALNAPVVLFGFGLPDDNLHAPNEKFTLEQFFNGILASAFLYQEVAETKQAGQAELA